MMGENLFRYLTIRIKVCNSARFCGKDMSVIALILRSSALSPSGVHVNPKKDVWSTLSWNLSRLNHTLLPRAVSRTFSMC